MAWIPAVIIQQDSSVFINSTTGVVGQTMLIPTPSSGGQVDSDYWAVPVTGFGIVGTGFTYYPTTPGDVDKPDPMAFHVVRVIKDNQSTDWYAVGNSTQYSNASEDVECCTSPPAIMPLASSLPIFAPCQTLCNLNDAGTLYIGVFAAPSPDTGTYTANGYYNGVALPQITGATVAALVTALNANASWGTAGIGTWTNPSGNTLIVTQGVDADGTDTLCAVFALV